MIPGYMLAFANHLWQSTLFAGVAGLLALALRKNHARVRHGVWLAASCKFLIPFSVLVALGGQIRWRTPTESAQRATALPESGEAHQGRKANRRRQELTG